MIITRTPFRISFLGGGSDYPAWFREHGGAVLGTAIDKYCYISVRRLPPFFEHRHRIVYSKIELVQDVAEIRHPAVRSVLAELGVSEGLEIHHDGDLPARSGLGSSSAFTVGLLNAVHALKGRRLDARTLGAEAIRIEQEVLEEHVGCQDQIWAAFGGLNRIDFRPDGAFEVTPLPVSASRRAELESSLLLVFTGLSRFAPDLARAQIDNIRRRSNASELGLLRAMVDEGQAILVDERTPLAELGRLLHESWQLKRALAEGVTTPLVDEIYAAAREAGASGGKLMGAGGGGFMVFLVEPSRRAHVAERLARLVQVPVRVEREGSRVIVDETNGGGPD